MRRWAWLAAGLGWAAAVSAVTHYWNETAGLVLACATLAVVLVIRWRQR